MMADYDILLPLPKSARSVKRRGAARDAEAARLKALGWSLQEIADYLELNGDPTRAAAAIRRALANTVRVAKDEQRLLELSGIDELERACWVEMRARHIMVSNGRIIRGDDEIPLEDDRFVLECVDRILRIKEARAKLLGLNAPSRAEILTIDSVDSAIHDLEQEISQYRKHGLSVPQE
jgi:DNA-binding transcriptional MerR regulator